jgi:hypothetical protein
MHIFYGEMDRVGLKREKSLLAGLVVVALGALGAQFRFWGSPVHMVSLQVHVYCIFIGVLLSAVRVRVALDSVMVP